MDSVIGNELGDPSSNPGLSICISYSTNILEKGMQLTSLLPAMGK